MKSFSKKKRAGMHPSISKRKRLRIFKARSHILIAKCKESGKRRSYIKEADRTKENADNQFGGHKGKTQQKRSE